MNDGLRKWLRAAGIRAAKTAAQAAIAAIGAATALGGGASVRRLAKGECDG